MANCLQVIVNANTGATPELMRLALKLASHELVSSDMLDDVNRAKMGIMNHYVFKHHERIELSKGGRSLLQGWREPQPARAALGAHAVGLQAPRSAS